MGKLGRGRTLLIALVIMTGIALSLITVFTRNLTNHDKVTQAAYQGPVIAEEACKIQYTLDCILLDSSFGRQLVLQDLGSKLNLSQSRKGVTLLLAAFMPTRLILLSVLKSPVQTTPITQY